MSKQFLDKTNFINTLYALDIAIENHFSNLLLGGDISRVVYSDTSFALRRRVKDSNWDESFLPFMNYSVDSISEGTNRSIWSSSGKIGGIWVRELNKYMRMAPVTISFDSTVWYHQHLDNLFALTEVVWDDTSETIIDYSVNVLDIDGVEQELKMFGILAYNFSYNPSFSRSDWLQENKIHSNSLNFEIQTYILKEGSEAWLPEEVVFEFARGKGMNPEEYDDTISIMHDYTDFR